MKKTVHIINAMQIGGVEVGVLSLLKSDLFNEYEVLLVKGYDDNLYNSLSIEEKEKVHVATNYVHALYLLIKLRPGLIISSLWRAHFVVLIYKLCLFKVNNVHFVHSARFGHIIDGLITKASLKFSNYIFCDSLLTKKWLLKNTKVKNAYVVNMNVSFSNKTKKFKYAPLSFVFVGRFSKQKNLSLAIEFIEQLNLLGVNTCYDLYGRDDGELMLLKQLVDEKGLNSSVNFRGVISPEEVERKMREYNYYLQTSYVEGMAISVFQSIKNGLLPVVTPVGEIPNYSKHLTNAFFIDECDIKKSALDFFEAIKYERFNVDNIGSIINNNDYKSFDVDFFDKIKSLR